VSSETRWIAVLSALTLIIGIFIGIAMDRFLFSPPPPPPVAPLASGGAARYGQMALRRLTRTLDLSPDQRDKMQEIFRRYMPELQSAGMGGDDLRSIRMKMREEIRGVLTPDQFTKFEEESRERMRRFQQMRKGEAPMPPARQGDSEPRKEEPR